MDYLSTAFFGIFLNITGICLWGITLFYFVKNKNKGNYTAISNVRKDNQTAFDKEIFAQIVKQQSEQSFERISDAIKKERQLLRAFIERGELNESKALLLEPNSNKVRSMILKKGTKKPQRRLKEGDKYNDVLKLAGMGLTTRQISEKVNLPKGEVELLIKLRKRKFDECGGNAARVRAFS
jgi:hypothetical protein